jgi:predicted secreted protein
MSEIDEKQIHGMLYTKLTDVIGRWQADILESYLKSEGIDAVLFQDAMSHVTLTPVFAEVQIYVPKAGIKKARELLEKFTATEDDGQE